MCGGARKNPNFQSRFFLVLFLRFLKARLIKRSVHACIACLTALANGLCERSALIGRQSLFDGGLSVTALVDR